MDALFNLLAPFLTADFVGKMVRTGIQSVSAGVVANGYVTADQQQAVAGAVGLAVSTLWTAVAHYRSVQAGKANATVGGLQ